ncbi:GNAT family N-acetyltransferase [Aspergillus candidus]|uniref:Acyl-CoA N-acyltransferase n=1 Tax=Aspergillus candidus TaxID=41067 RepID=A0A2I2FIC0_ASPCN|nr:acyl-CoA N-acyltransferase [Aspergillus candidus]PLB40359.1 acyl-CoA N-acyltransferase [Aspergillus candidus]
MPDVSLYPTQPTVVVIPPDPPEIQTQRLTLRPLRIGNEADADGLFAIRRRQEVADWLWPRVPHHSVEETKEWMRRREFEAPDASGAVGRQFTFVIIRTDDPSEQIIGSIGINSLDPAPSLGYGIHPEFWGQGYASEAVRGLADAWWKLPRMGGNGETDGERLWAATNRANQGSVRTLEKCDFRIFRELQLEGDTVVVMYVEM